MFSHLGSLGLFAVLLLAGNVPAFADSAIVTDGDPGNIATGHTQNVRQSPINGRHRVTPSNDIKGHSLGGHDSSHRGNDVTNDPVYPLLGHGGPAVNVNGRNLIIRQKYRR
jgi:hypothetical protein